MTIDARRFYERVKARLDFPARKKHQKLLAVRKTYYRAYWKNVAAAYGAQIEDVGYNIFKIAKDSQYTFVRDSEVMLDNHLSLNIMGNKPLAHRLLHLRQVPAPCLSCPPSRCLCHCCSS